MKSVLAKTSSTLGVGLLLESIAQTADFEREMARKFSLNVSPRLAARRPLYREADVLRLAVRRDPEAFADHVRRRRGRPADLERI